MVSAGENIKPQIKAPRVTPLEGVYTYACGHTWVRSREPAGFRYDERRLIFAFYYEKVFPQRYRTRMTRIRRIFTDNFNPCVSVSSAQSVFYRISHPSAFICVHLRFISTGVI